MSDLSSPLQDILPEYAVIVVGSGYGGGVAASRLARAGKRVCVLERGKERQAGEFPNTELQILEEFQVDVPDKHIGLRTALFDIRNTKEINAVVGCGPGGTSPSIPLRARETLLRETHRVEQAGGYSPHCYRTDIFEDIVAKYGNGQT